MGICAAAALTSELSEPSWPRRVREAEMTVPVRPPRVSRRAVLKGGALTIAFASSSRCVDLFAQDGGSSPRILDPKEVDGFFAVNGDGTVTVFCGKVDLGQGLRIAIRQMAAEELGIGVEKIKYVEGIQPSPLIKGGPPGRAVSSAVACRLGKLPRRRVKHSSNSLHNASAASPKISLRLTAKYSRKQAGPAFPLQP